MCITFFVKRGRKIHGRNMRIDLFITKLKDLTPVFFFFSWQVLEICLTFGWTFMRRHPS